MIKQRMKRYKNQEINLYVKKMSFLKKQKKTEKIILSDDYSIQLLKDVHENFCHIGIQQVEKNICPYYTAKNLTKNIKKIYKNCTICIKNKSRGQPKCGLISHLGPATAPFKIMSIDTVGGFRGSRSTKKYLHLLVDHFTRYSQILTSKMQLILLN